MFGQLLKWIACDGGPHLILPREVLCDWQACDASCFARLPPYDGPTDYARACTIALEREVGIICVGGMSGLVVGGEVPMSTWIARDDRCGGDLVVALEWGRDAADDDILASLAELQDESLRQEDLHISVGQGGLVHFAACDRPPRWVYSHHEAPIRPGTYQIASEVCSADPVDFRVHRLSLVMD